MIVGVDIGGHHIAAALVDAESWGIAPGSYRHLEVERDAGSEELLTAWAGLIDEVSARSEGGPRQVGVAMPGPFDYRTGVAFFRGTKKFESLYGIDVGRELSARCRGEPEVRFLNDATAFAVGCSGEFDTLKKGHVLAITLGTGLGSAFLKDGIPVIEGRGGELPPHGSLWHLPFKDGIADEYVSSRWILGCAAQSGVNLTSVIKVAALARTDGRAREIFAEYGANLAAIVAPWIRSFQCEKIVLGGRITGAFDLFSPSLEDGLVAVDALRPIFIHENTEDAAILGAAMTFDEPFWELARTRLPDR